MKSAKKAISVVLVAVMLLMTMATPALAASKVDITEGPMKRIEAGFYMLVDKLIQMLGKILNTFIPGLDWGKTWVNYDDYQTPETFYKGEDTFDNEVKEGSVWSAGYAYGSLLEGLDILSGEFALAGALQTLQPHTPESILDDQGVNVYALSDGVSGTVVHAVIDGYGIARGDVLKIREQLASFAAENNIISINISALHQHTLIDTLGMGVALVPALIINPGMSVMEMDRSTLQTGKSRKFMNNLYEVVTETITEAVEDMEEGTLYYGCADAADLMYDKRKPAVFDGEIHRLRFDPKDDASDELWICEAGIHCTSYSASDTFISSDYPYYFKEYIKEATGADVVFVQGAELAITAERDNIKPEGTGENARVKGYAKELANRVIAIENDEVLEPVLNITVSETSLTADNPVLILATREGIVDPVATKNGSDFTIITEIGYMELGGKIGIALIPGEIAPEILWGGVVSADASWTGTNWSYAPMEETAKAEKLLCFGLTNDQIGYILPDNDVHSMLTENEEINAASVKAGSVITSAFEELIASVK